MTVWNNQLLLLVAMSMLTIAASCGRIITPDQLVKMLVSYKVQPHEAQIQRQNLCAPAAPGNGSNLQCSLSTGRTTYKGACVGLLRQGPCPPLHWIVIHKKTGAAVCQFQVCEDHHVLVGGACTRQSAAASEKHCPATQQLIINEFGEAECECPVGRAYHRQSARCYEPYSRGPCSVHQVIQVVDDSRTKVGYGKCVDKLCPSSGQVPMTPTCELVVSPAVSPSQYQCYVLNTIGPCNDGFLSLDDSFSNVKCTSNVPYALFASLPSRPCSRGSRRGSMGRCREEFPAGTLEGNNSNNSNNEGRISLAPTVRPGMFDNGSVCPEDYFFLGGSCIHIIRGT